MRWRLFVILKIWRAFHLQRVNFGAIAQARFAWDVEFDYCFVASHLAVSSFLLSGNVTLFSVCLIHLLGLDSATAPQRCSAAVQILVYAGAGKHLAYFILGEFCRGTLHGFGAGSHHNARHNMHGLFQKLFKLKTSSSETSHTKPTLRSSNSFGPAPSPPSRKNPSTPPLQSALKSPQRWSRKYDVFVCHSSVESDVEVAMGLVSFLEGSPRGLRCFLWERDAEPGGAVASEMCRAVQDSHMRAMLISPAFLQDGWCKYMMHQALAEGPMSGRTIPLLSGISFSECPQELRFYFNITLSSDAERGYATLNNAVLRYLQGLMKQEQTLDLIMHSSHCGLSQPGGPGDEQGSPKDSSETLISTEVISSTEDVVDAAIKHPAAEVQDSWL